MSSIVSLIPRLSLLAMCAIVFAGSAAIAQGPSPAPAPKEAGPGRGFPSPEERQRLQEETTADHRAMMEQLGIKRLRPGPSGPTRFLNIRIL
jgi:hypothetical protein